MRVLVKFSDTELLILPVLEKLLPLGSGPLS